MERIEYYDQYEKSLTKELLSICVQHKVIDDQLLVADELAEKWHEIAPEYMQNAIPEIANYPLTAIAWAAYVGMGMAYMWDSCWDTCKDKKDIYSEMVKKRGFDCLDEYVLEELYKLDLDSDKCKKVDSLLKSCAETANTLIRKEDVEPQSVDAFHIYARTEKVMFHIGVSVGLKLLGYKYEKITLPQA